MDSKRIVRPLSLLSALTSLLFAPPASKAQPTILGQDTVCATGTCCPQNTAFCFDGVTEYPDKYFLTSGPCS